MQEFRRGDFPFLSSRIHPTSKGCSLLILNNEISCSWLFIRVRSSLDAAVELQDQHPVGLAVREIPGYHVCQVRIRAELTIKAL